MPSHEGPEALLPMMKPMSALAVSFHWPYWTEVCMIHGSTPRAYDVRRDPDDMDELPCPYCAAKKKLRVPLRPDRDDSFVEYRLQPVQWAFADGCGEGLDWKEIGIG